ncbi:MAG: putative lipid kinase YegS [Candidatus Erwinia impunctatus]|nr:putative lipid kinase YegS [Culicoides impunctatus]
MTQATLTIVILNGKAAGNDELRTAINALRDEGISLAVRATWEHGDAKRYVAEAVELGATTVIAAGGDGTVNEIASALTDFPADRRPALGIIPLGTANDFATSAGIPADMNDALRLAVMGRAVAVDLACVNQSHYFINMATGGFGTRITTETPEKLKSALGGVSYFIHGLLRMDTLKADRCELTGPDFHWTGDALVLGIGNGRQAGGGRRLCPDALINDGKLELSIIAARELLPTLFNSAFGEQEEALITRVSLPWLTIETPHTMTFNLDGEPISGVKFHIEVLPGVIHCRLPPSCELLV